MLAQILARGRFLSRIRARGVNAKKWGLKNPSNAFYSKAAGMSAKRSTQKKSISDLSVSRWAIWDSTARIDRWSRSSVIG
jgi:hypothetical protein